MHGSKKDFKKVLEFLNFFQYCSGVHYRPRQSSPKHYNVLYQKNLNLGLIYQVNTNSCFQIAKHILLTSNPNHREWIVMGRAWNFRASGGLGLLCIGPRAGRAFLYRASGFIRAFVKHKINLIFGFMYMKYEFFQVEIF